MEQNRVKMAICCSYAQPKHCSFCDSVLKLQTRFVPTVPDYPEKTFYETAIFLNLNCLYISTLKAGYIKFHKVTCLTNKSHARNAMRFVSPLWLICILASFRMIVGSVFS